MNEIDYLHGAFNIDGKADYGACRDHDDYGHNPFWCAACGEITARRHESKLTPSVCRFCCPVRAAERAAEIAAESL